MTDRYDIYKCYACKAENIDERDIDIRTTFYGTLEEPPEYEWHCPHCGSEEIDEMPWCAGCGDVRVSDEDDLCDECYMESVADQEERWAEERGMTND